MAILKAGFRRSRDLKICWQRAGGIYPHEMPALNGGSIPDLTCSACLLTAAAKKDAVSAEPVKEVKEEQEEK